MANAPKVIKIFIISVTADRGLSTAGLIFLADVAPLLARQQWCNSVCVQILHVCAGFCAKDYGDYFGLLLLLSRRNQ